MFIEGLTHGSYILTGWHGQPGITDGPPNMKISTYWVGEHGWVNEWINLDTNVARLEIPDRMPCHRAVDANGTTTFWLGVQVG